jgi:hypothetical protein
MKRKIIIVLQLMATYNIVTCKAIRVKKITGSSSDDWIYQHFSYTLSLNYN